MEKGVRAEIGLLPPFTLETGGLRLLGTYTQGIMFTFALQTLLSVKVQVKTCLAN